MSSSSDGKYSRATLAEIGLFSLPTSAGLKGQCVLLSGWILPAIRSARLLSHQPGTIYLSYIRMCSRHIALSKIQGSKTRMPWPKIFECWQSWRWELTRREQGQWRRESWPVDASFILISSERSILGLSVSFPCCMTFRLSSAALAALSWAASKAL